MNRSGTEFRKKTAALMALILLPGIAVAAEILYAEVERDGDVYRVEFLVGLDAPPNRVRAITDDYARFPALSPTILESEVLERRNDGSVRVRVVLRPCVLLFCKRIVKISDAERMPGGEVRYVADARASDFHAAVEWLWVEPGERKGVARAPDPTGKSGSSSEATLVRYRAQLIPRFFVPPVIGPWLVRRQILHELSVVSERVESLAVH